jgi:hypothetical protein
MNREYNKKVNTLAYQRIGLFYCPKEKIMAELLDYIPSIAVGTTVSRITGKNEDGFTAGGFAAFMLAISGENPSVLQLPNKRAQLVLTKNQSLKLQEWLDRQMRLAVSKPKTPPSLDMVLAPALVPWALKYVIPTALLFVILGWLGHWYLSR